MTATNNVHIRRPMHGDDYQVGILLAALFVGLLHLSLAWYAWPRMRPRSARAKLLFAGALVLPVLGPALVIRWMVPTGDGSAPANG